MFALRSNVLFQWPLYVHHVLPNISLFFKVCVFHRDHRYSINSGYSTVLGIPSGIFVGNIHGHAIKKEWQELVTSLRSQKENSGAVLSGAKSNLRGAMLKIILISNFSGSMWEETTGLLPSIVCSSWFLWSRFGLYL